MMYRRDARNADINAFSDAELGKRQQTEIRLARYISFARKLICETKNHKFCERRCEATFGDLTLKCHATESVGNPVFTAKYDYMEIFYKGEKVLSRHHEDDSARDYRPGEWEGKLEELIKKK